MKIPVWKEGMTAEQGKDIAYMERNLLALYLAREINLQCAEVRKPPACGWYYDYENNWKGWLRVVSINHGSMTFHVPDDFPLGGLPEIKPNWDGHTTEQKWHRVMIACGVATEDDEEDES